MNILRNEIRTGLLVVLSLAALTALLLYLGAPGVFVPQHTYRIFFDNAAGIKPGITAVGSRTTNLSIPRPRWNQIFASESSPSKPTEIRKSLQVV